MRDEATAWLVREGVAEEDRQLRIMVDARYDGQNFEVSVPLDDVREDGLDDMVQRFRRQHVQEYGYDVSDRPVEIVNCRIQAIGRVARVPVSAPVPVPGLDAVKGRRPVYFGKDAGWVETSIYRRGQLPIGRTFAGPAIIEEMSSTLIVQPGQTVTVDPVGNLIVSIFE